MIFETVAKFLPYLSFMVGASLWSKSGRKPTDDALIIFIIGAPGAGKGTQSTFLVKRFGLQHLSYGDLMRGLRKSGDPGVSGLKTKSGTDNPSVPDDMGAWLLWREIRNGGLEGKELWLVDGFPRRPEQVEEWLHLLPPAVLTLYLKCPQDISKQRVASRGEKAGVEARPEDLNPQTAMRRIDEFHKNVDFVVAKLEEKGMKVFEVDAHRSPVDVQKELEKIMEPLIQSISST
ncbi:Uridylate kinase [Colletotrichum siamense]|uniref:Uridylate kinase n=1 Tax=Colletotrichum siamense TaxID=690259 RepID=A0A9P5F2U2_COLSI|nr:Uridylate kinase [Colletotrichum siamense]KAF4864700.1 Uridylate kinase [Colletotrichum siamense]